MQEFFTERLKVFLGGCFAGGIASVNWLFINSNVYLAFGVKLMGAIIIALFSGVITLFARDLYKHLKRKYKFFKNDNEKDDESKVA